jgi:hypothetical protein
MFFRLEREIPSGHTRGGSQVQPIRRPDKGHRDAGTCGVRQKDTKVYCMLCTQEHISLRLRPREVFRRGGLGFAPATFPVRGRREAHPDEGGRGGTHEYSL